MRKVFVIGIGAGNPDHLTFEGAAAIAATDVFFVIDKGAATSELRDLRDELIARHAREHRHRVVLIPEADRDRAPTDYETAVVDWHQERAERIGRALADDLADNGTGAFLVWGDPSLYDSTLRVLDRVEETGVVFERIVVPGVSSLHALAARHLLALHGIGEPVLITTGRRLADDLAHDIPNVVVMLDGQEAYAQIDPTGLDIYWAAYLGTPAEIALAGPLADVRDAVTAARHAAREQHGWIMDIYLLRRRAAG